MLFCSYVVIAITGAFFSHLGTRRHDNYEYYFHQHPAGTISVYVSGVITFLAAGLVVWRNPRQIKISGAFLSAACGFFSGIIAFLMTPFLITAIDRSHISTLLVSAIVGVAIGFLVFVVCRRFSR